MKLCLAKLREQGVKANKNNYDVMMTIKAFHWQVVNS